MPVNIKETLGPLVGALKGQEIRLTRRDFLKLAAGGLAGYILFGPRPRQEKGPQAAISAVLKEKETDPFYIEIKQVFQNNDRQIAGLILAELKRAETLNRAGEKQQCYWRAACIISAKYQASGADAQSRDPRILNLLRELKNQAKYQPGYQPEKWNFANGQNH